MPGALGGARRTLRHVRRQYPRGLRNSLTAWWRLRGRGPTSTRDRSFVPLGRLEPVPATSPPGHALNRFFARSRASRVAPLFSRTGVASELRKRPFTPRVDRPAVPPGTISRAASEQVAIYEFPPPNGLHPPQPPSSASSTRVACCPHGAPILADAFEAVRVRPRHPETRTWRVFRPSPISRMPDCPPGRETSSPGCRPLRPTLALPHPSARPPVTTPTSSCATWHAGSQRRRERGTTSASWLSLGPTTHFTFRAWANNEAALRRALERTGRPQPT